MKRRGGSVLGKKTILKSDHFPGCQNKRLRPNIEGAPNYRQVHLHHTDFITFVFCFVNCFRFNIFAFVDCQAEKLHVHGVTIPTIDGIRNVLKHIGAEIEGEKKVHVLWINLREEPVN